MNSPAYDITNLAALLQARDISKFPSIAHKSVRIIRYKGDDKQNSDLEQEGKRGYAIGFSGIIRFILDRIPKQEDYKDGVRRTIYQYPEIAIRVHFESDLQRASRRSRSTQEAA